MFISKLRSFILFFLILNFSFGFTENNNQWAEFLEKPDSNSFTTLHQLIKNNKKFCIRGSKNSHLRNSLSNNRSLFQLISKGDEFSLKIGLLIEKCFDGGELGDFYKNSGLFYDSWPNKFFVIIKELSVDSGIVSHILISLPVSSVDQPELQLSIVEHRIKKLERQSGERVFEINKHLITQLKKKREFIVENNK